MTLTAQLRRGNKPHDSSAYPSDWYIEDEETVPGSRPHDLRIEEVRDLLEGWRRRTKRKVLIGRELAFRWDEDHPGVGVDPDIYVADPPPPEADDLISMRTWRTGHHPPALAVEVCSRSRPDKDYVKSPARHAHLGTSELWIFDPDLLGKAPDQGPVPLQKFQPDAQGNFVRTYAGPGPMYSEYLGAWVFASDDEGDIKIADDREGTSWWLTPEEMERAAKLEERSAKEQALTEQARERSAKEQALARIAELEKLLAARG